MRYIAFILLLLPFMAFGQYPDGPSNPIRLGVQTTANGLAYTSDTGPTLNPANDTSAYLWLDTLAGRLWYWDNGAWDTLARYWVKTGNNIYYDVGKVGIGTNNPTSTLDISDLVGSISFNTELASSYNFLTFNNSGDGNSANISYYGANDDLIITGGGLYIGNSYSPSVNIAEEDVFIEESLYINRTATNDSDSILVIQGDGLVGYRTDIISTDDQTLSIDSTGRVFSLSIEGGNTITFEDTKNTISNTMANGNEIYYYTGSQWNRSGLYVDGFNNTYLSISDYNSAPDSLLVISSQKIKRTAISDVFGASIHEENAQNTNLTISQSEVEDHARVVCAINKQSAHVNDIEVELPAPTAAMAGKLITLNIEDDDSGAGEEINIKIAGGASRLRIYPATTQVDTYTPITGTGFIVLNLYVVYSHDAGAYIYDLQ